MGALHDHFDDVRREADHVVHGGAQFVVQAGDQRLPASGSPGAPRASDARDHRIALLGAGHGFHHVAGEGRMQVAEEADGAAVRPKRHQHVDVAGLGDAFRLHRLAVFVDSLEVAAVEDDVVVVFAGEHGVGLRAGGHQDRCGRAASTCLARGDSLPVASSQSYFERRATAAPVAIHFHFFGRQALGEAHAFFERLGDFFVIERVAGRIDQAAAVGDGDAAPGIQQIDEIAASGLRARPPRVRREWRGRGRGTLRRFRSLPASIWRALRARPVPRPASRSARGISPPARRNRRAIRWPCRSRSGRRR